MYSESLIDNYTRTYVYSTRITDKLIKLRLSRNRPLFKSGVYIDPTSKICNINVKVNVACKENA